MSVKLNKFVCLDIDDCILCFGGLICQLFNAKNGTCLSKSDITSWDFKDIDLKDARGNIAKGANLRKLFLDYENHGLYAALPVIPEAKQALRLMKNMGYNIALITARDEKFKKDTEISFISQDIPYDEMIFNWDKAKVINKLKHKNEVVCFADDKFSTVEAVSKLCDLPNNFLVNKPYNENEIIPDNVIRIDSLLEIVRYLK